MSLCAGQYQADITKAETDEEMREIINNAPREYRQQLINHAMVVRKLKHKAEMQSIELFARQRAEGWDAWGNEV